MPHLYQLRAGWEGERLAHYLLSRVAFVAQPTTIADDVGSDFFCTLFDILETTPAMIQPRISFAIQVKSNVGIIDMTNKIQYLEQLEIPFFIGVVDQETASLRVYSAEWLPMMFAGYGVPKKLSLRPVETLDPKDPWDVKRAPDEIVLNCYYVRTFDASEPREGIRVKAEDMIRLCQRATLNIGSRRAEEHLYHWPYDVVTVTAGSGSVERFRDNVYKRLAEAFTNFAWLLEHEPGQFHLAEFQTYEAFFLALTKVEVTRSLGWVNTCYINARRVVDRVYFPTPDFLLERR